MKSQDFLLTNDTSRYIVTWSITGFSYPDVISDTKVKLYLIEAGTSGSLFDTHSKPSR